MGSSAECRRSRVKSEDRLVGSYVAAETKGFNESGGGTMTVPVLFLTDYG